MGFGIDKLVYSPSNDSDGSQVAAYLKDGSGNLLTSTLIGTHQSLDVNTTQTVTPQDKTVTGALAATNASISLTTNGTDGGILELTGTFVGTINVQGSIDGGTTYTSIPVMPLSGSSTLITAITAAGVYKVSSISSFSKVQVIMSSFTSGSATATLELSMTNGLSQSYQTNPANLKTTAYLNDGVGNSIASTLVNSLQSLNVTDPSIHQDNATYTAGSDYGAYVLGVNNSTGKYAPLSINSDGALKVDATLVPTFAHTENTTHTVGDVGSFTLAYRQDTLVTDITATGNYAGLKSNNRGALWVAPTGTVADGVTDTENPVKVGSVATAGALTATTTGNRANLISDLYRRAYVNTSANVAPKTTQTTVGTTAAALLTTQLTGRRTILIQNIGPNAIYVGDSTVTVSSGLRIATSADLSLDIGDGVSLYAISTAAGQNVRILEIA